MSQTTKKMVIWIVLILFLLSTGLTSFLYFFSTTPTPEVKNYKDIENREEDLMASPSSDSLAPVVTDNESVTEMDQVVEVPLGDGSLDAATLGDFSESLQLN